MAGGGHFVGSIFQGWAQVLFFLSFLFYLQHKIHLVMHFSFTVSPTNGLYFIEKKSFITKLSIDTQSEQSEALLKD